jgi:hypothetical protein
LALEFICERSSISNHAHYADHQYKHAKQDDATIKVQDADAQHNNSQRECPRKPSDARHAVILTANRQVEEQRERSFLMLKRAAFPLCPLNTNTFLARIKVSGSDPPPNGSEKLGERHLPPRHKGTKKTGSSAVVGERESIQGRSSAISQDQCFGFPWCRGALVVNLIFSMSAGVSHTIIGGLHGKAAMLTARLQKRSAQMKCPLKSPRRRGSGKCS